MTLLNKRWISIGWVMAGLLGLSACGGNDSNDDIKPDLTIFTITPSAGANGSISPATGQQVWVAWNLNQGSTTSFTITPDTGYSIASVGGTCGGILNGNTYTTNPIHKDCTVEASFVINGYSISPSAEANGRIEPASTTVIEYGTTTSFTLTPDPSYEIAGVGGSCGGTLNGNVYTINAISADCTVIASFNLIPPTKPVLSLTPQSIKTLAFSWATIAGTAEYRLLENADGSSGFTQVATLAADASSYQHTVFLPSRINASYILEACNNAGCTESATAFVSGSLAEATGYIKASNAEEGDSFGFSVALAADGNTLAVGAFLEDSNARGINGDESNNTAVNSGAVYVFSRGDGLWQQQAYVKASNTGAFDQFGYSIALAADGNTLAVGARLEDSNATGINGNGLDNSATNSGAVYVFSRSDTSWSQQAYIKASNTDAYSSFGESLALAADGNTLAVGAYGESSNATGINGDETDVSASESGAVYVFSRSDTSWSQQAYIKASNTGAGDQFGKSLALAADGNTLAVGAINESSNATGINGNQSSNAASNSGAVYVFSRNDTSWSQQAYIKASNTRADDNFGYSLALAADGNTLAVGAINENSSATGVNGDETDNTGSNSGAVYVFGRSDTAWSQQAYVKASNTEAGNEFGHSLALAADGNTLAVGAHRENSNATGINGDETNTAANNSGAVYLFTRSGEGWNQLAYIKAPNTEANSQFGGSVTLAADGKTLAVGARGEGSNSGAVYLY